MGADKKAGGNMEWGCMLKKLSPYTIQKGLRYLKHYGPKEFWVRLHERFEPEEIPYGPWYEAYIPTEETLRKQAKKKFAYAPLISIVVPAYRTPETFLRQMIDSVRSQTYGNWELCIANGSPEDEKMGEILREYHEKDSRVSFKNLKENLGIAENTNEAFAMAKGEFVGLLDHDDLLAPNALYEIISRLQEETVDAVYTDEDKVTTDLTEHFQPHLKPDFNLDLLRSNNYICHFFVVRRAIVEKVGGFRREFDGAQDYDFIFRCVETSRAVAHVPEILYHWRTHKASTADNPASKMYAFEAGRRAIEAHLERTQTPGTVSHTKDYGFYRVQYPVKKQEKISILIPNKDEKESLKSCLESIWQKSTYKNYEIIIIENNSTTEEIFEYYRELESAHENLRVVAWEKEFNYSAINNFGARYATGEYLLFLNNDVTVITQDWLEEMLGVCQRKEVGAVGVKLFYPDGTIQHAGCVVGLGGVAGHLFVDMPGDRTGYLHKASLLQDLSAVTAACMMMKKAVFWEAGGFTEKLAVAFNDVDLCLKVREKGWLIVYDPYVQLYHMESKTRGAEDDKQKVRRFQTEIEYMRSHWLKILKGGDPYYNKNLSLTKWNYSLRPLGTEKQTRKQYEKSDGSDT
ncbi:MAG TPA: glycosyltransferase family 2 protein [Candidatus Blautia intestinigallinarum]|nr:glycosyltransferase family 2 protein [Candidatus Blautia intestinigallinarum]